MEHKYTMKEYYKKLENLQARIEQHQKRLATMAETVTRLEKLCEWISVDDRLPEDGISALTGFANCTLLPDKLFFHKGEWYHMGGYRALVQPTHWMPMPDSPKEKE